MAERVFVVSDPRAIEFIESEDFDGFKAYLDEHPASEIGKEEFFRDMVKKGEAGKNLKCICTSRERCY